MKGLNNFILLLIVSVFFTGCNSDELSPQEYLRYVDDASNGLFADRTNGSIIYTMKYLPPAYCVINDKLRTEAVLDRNDTEEDIKDLDKVFCFMLEIKEESGADILKYGITSTEEYRERIAFLDVYCAGLFALNYNGQIIQCSHAQFEQTYGAAPYCRIDLYFSTDKATNQSLGEYPGDMVVEFNDIIWGSGMLKFRFIREKLNNIPKIKY